MLPIRKTSLKLVVKSLDRGLFFPEVNHHPGLVANALDGEDCALSRVTSGARANDTATTARRYGRPKCGGARPAIRKVMEDRVGSWRRAAASPASIEDSRISAFWPALCRKMIVYDASKLAFPQFSFQFTHCGICS